jgi:hypothetical protein
VERRRRARDSREGPAERGRSGAINRPRALITGASAGIGEGFAHHLARRGYDLVLVARRRHRLDALAARLSDVSATIIEADLASDHGVAAVEARLREGDIDVFVNNAGISSVGEFWKLPITRELQLLDLNVRTLARLAHTALAAMIPRRSGAIITVASGAAFQPIPHHATYAASKAFMLHFSEALHEEARPYGVTVTAVCPGPVRTELLELAGFDENRIPPLAWVSVDRVVEEALRAVAAGRAVAIPGTVNRAATWVVRLTPRFLARRLAGVLIRRAVKR